MISFTGSLLSYFPSGQKILQEATYGPSTTRAPCIPRGWQVSDVYFTRTAYPLAGTALFSLRLSHVHEP